MVAITIDTGTTNTRVYAWRDHEIVAEAFRPVGVRDTAITGSKQTLQEGVKAAIAEVMEKAGIADAAEVTFLASGMITSNVGLLEVPHLAAPAGLRELARGMVKMVIPEVIEQPIWFVPGVKNNVPGIDPDHVEAMDIMRGEEVEVIGLMEHLHLQGPAVFLLPGSHTKIVHIDENNRITGSITTISGELLDVLTKQTILAGSLQRSFAEEIDERMLLKGAQQVQEVGLARTCFSVRIFDLFTDRSLNEKCNFLLGAVLADDLVALKNSQAFEFTPDVPIVIMGKKILQEALHLLIKHDPSFTGPLHLADEQLKAVAGRGALAVMRERENL